MLFLPTVRYLVFASFIVCNSVLASVAVWNASLSPPARDSRLDTYIVVVGALGLALTFAIIFTELVRRNAFTSRVWFETLWTLLFFLLDLGGASALAAVGPDDMCNQQSPPSNSNTGQQCTSLRVLMAFTWLAALILLIYFVLLIVLVAVNSNNESVPRIWVCTIHNFPPLMSAVRSHSPALPRFTSGNKMSEVVTPLPLPAPMPQRPTVVPSALYSMGLGSQYEIEYFQPPAPTSPVVSPADHLHRHPSTAGSVQAALALYPQFLSSAYVAQPPPGQPSPSVVASPLPPPLAPVRVKRKPPPLTITPQTSSKPMGPRMRSGPANTSSHRERRT